MRTQAGIRLCDLVNTGFYARSPMIRRREEHPDSRKAELSDYSEKVIGII
ncbi:hypothetical protein FHW69_000382 [Luteibacter sp. Sphag1AF]|nr:hypothetical protein [Luteibacter sp. Sphag1AF]